MHLQATANLRADLLDRQDLHSKSMDSLLGSDDSDDAPPAAAVADAVTPTMSIGAHAYGRLCRTAADRDISPLAAAPAAATVSESDQLFPSSSSLPALRLRREPGSQEASPESPRESGSGRAEFASNVVPLPKGSKLRGLSPKASQPGTQLEGQLAEPDGKLDGKLRHVMKGLAGATGASRGLMKLFARSAWRVLSFSISIWAGRY